MNCCRNLVRFEGIYLKFESGVISQKFCQGFFLKGFLLKYESSNQIAHGPSILRF